ncbi:MAG: fatty acid desaturase, partial [Deltaproteobacteria bacterium]
MTAPIAPATPFDDDAEWMAPPPSLAPVGDFAPVSSAPSPPAPRATVAAIRPADASARPPLHFAAAPPPQAPHVASYVEHLASRHEQLAEMHRAFVRQQVEIQSQFVQLTLAPLAAWAARGGGPVAPAVTSHAPFVAPPSLAAVSPAAPVAPVAATPARVAKPTQPAPAARVEPPAPAAIAATAGPGVTTRVAPPRTPTGPRFDRKQLEVHASGAISTIFGERFEQQDGFARQVRMPEPPLLLADRVLGIEGPPGDLGLGTIWTETDVTTDAWYLHEGRMPAGVMVESGQADLMLISWLGADFLNRGERVYRLLGCELRSHGELPRPGDTLHYQILVDGHAEQDGVRLFFFHYDCWVNGELRMSVRSGQAGFFTNEELADSAGVLWSAQTAKPRADARLDAPVAICTRDRFSASDITALIEGRLTDCFGPGFERADTHTRTPTIAGGRMRLLDEVTHFDRAGGPWKRLIANALWAGLIINTVLASTFYMPLHEATHKNIWGQNPTARWGENLIGMACSIPSGISFTSHRPAHMRHHAFTNDPDRDPDHFTEGPLRELPLKWIRLVVLTAFLPLFALVPALRSFIPLKVRVSGGNDRKDGLVQFRFWAITTLVLIVAFATGFGWQA